MEATEEYGEINRMNPIRIESITAVKQSTIKSFAYFMRYTVDTVVFTLVLTHSSQEQDYGSMFDNCS